MLTSTRPLGVIKDYTLRVMLRNLKTMPLKSPMICGKHLFGVIQCSRGIGDYNLRAGHENILVKPFFHRNRVSFNCKIVITQMIPNKSVVDS